ncbi:formate dehydrogenase subunit gamma [Pseudoroseomonas ludipueritiae]|uniref:Formate dehydrogenase subunit gamma n=1 Tax=Pseudoroseomonas ludipueritiae TaxID=198093 RepID=A0ABR7R1Y1_9PROT|nr:formate dehydrogenase subunit gamma [Pseudoroseomonas ludipueritiae]MBC9175712.1 formate dehydrogenase subunit gamma [Pseudoroseomonas ludipueritiae]MCG7363674.1 formate dehydrogenase subunit gamma [Roseomonas sp. ACRSG]
MVERIQPGDAVRPGKPVIVDRYGPAARVNHWIIAASLILLAISGLALFTPSLFFLTGLFGGGQNTRAFHPWIGVVLFVSFFAFFFQLWRANLPQRVDIVWLSKFRDLLSGHEENLPELGKYNAGQKFIFWGMSALIILLIVSGVVIWEQYFAEYFSIPTRRVAVLAHSIAAVLIICVFILHVYAAIWTRGTLRAMTRGTVTGGWAWRHHRKWLRELAGQRKTNQAK